MSLVVRPVAAQPAFGKVSKTKPSEGTDFKVFKHNDQNYYVTDKGSPDWVYVMSAYSNLNLSAATKVSTGFVNRHDLLQAAQATFAKLAAKADRTLTLKRPAQPEKLEEALA